MMQTGFSRRGFLFQLLALPFLASAQWLWAAAKKTVKTTPDAAAKALVKPTDAMPMALKYAEDATKAAGRTNKEAQCSNCMHYSQAVTADGKDIKVAGQPVGGCALFNAGQGFVKGSGWCMSWFKVA